MLGEEFSIGNADDAERAVGVADGEKTVADGGAGIVDDGASFAFPNDFAFFGINAPDAAIIAETAGVDAAFVVDGGTVSEFVAGGGEFVLLFAREFVESEESVSVGDAVNAVVIEAGGADGGGEGEGAILAGFAPDEVAGFGIEAVAVAIPASDVNTGAVGAGFGLGEGGVGLWHGSAPELFAGIGVEAEECAVVADDEGVLGDNGSGVDGAGELGCPIGRSIFAINGADDSVARSEI